MVRWSKLLCLEKHNVEIVSGVAIRCSKIEGVKVDKCTQTCIIQSQENVHLSLLIKQLADNKRGIENVLNAIQQGVLTTSTKQRLDELENAKNELKLKFYRKNCNRLY